MSGGSERDLTITDAYLAWLTEAMPGPQQIPPPRIIFEAGWRAALAHAPRRRARLVAASVTRGEVRRAIFTEALLIRPGSDADTICDAFTDAVMALLADPAAATPDDEIDQVWAHTIEECALIAEAHGAASAAEAIRAKLVANERAATPDATVHHADRISSAGVVTPSCRPGVLGDGERASMDAANVTCGECCRVIAAPDATNENAIVDASTTRSAPDWERPQIVQTYRQRKQGVHEERKPDATGGGA